MNDEPIADSRPSTGYRGVPGPGDPTWTISPEEAAREAELEQLSEQARQLAAKLPGLTVQEADAVVASSPPLQIRYIERRDLVTEMYVYGRVTALTREGVVTEASAG